MSSPEKLLLDKMDINLCPPAELLVDQTDIIYVRLIITYLSTWI